MHSKTNSRVFVIFFVFQFLFILTFKATAQNPESVIPNTEVGLRYYLSRAVTFSGYLWGQGNDAENLRMVRETGAKFIGRAILMWGGESGLDWLISDAKQRVDALHDYCPDVILQAGIFEIVTKEVDTLSVPAWAFEAFGQTAETRNFDYSKMLFPKGTTIGHSEYEHFDPTGHWGKDSSVPDIRSAETQMFFYYLARRYIDLGCEAIHWGQADLMGYADKTHASYSSLLQKVRAYAKTGARRGFVLNDATKGMKGPDGILVFDFHSGASIITEKSPYPDAEMRIRPGYGMTGGSMGGKTFFGWSCQHLPYLMELDNFGAEAVLGKVTEGISVYGYDEITWFSNLPKDKRDSWLAYQAKWIRDTDSAGYLEYPMSRVLSSNVNGKQNYFAHNPSAGVPDGFGQEQAIKDLIALYGTKP